ncbi:MAG: thioredoxin family protein, partial [Flavobacteriales bacterium]
LASAGALALAATHDPLPDLQIGAPLPAADIAMKDVQGGMHTLKGLMGARGLLVIFTCNTCPFVVGTEESEGWEGRYPEHAAMAARFGYGVAFINSNEAKRNDGDGYADMQQRWKEKGYGAPYLLDEGHRVADAFGARTTPHVFLFDKDGKLAYKGAIDDNVAKAAEVKERWLFKAMDALSAGKRPDPANTRNIGCSIKRVPHKH